MSGRDAAVVTGAGSGFGRGLALAAAERSLLVVAGDVDADAALETAELIRRAGGEATAEHVDVSDAASVDELAARTRSNAGAVRYLFNNAGVFLEGPMADSRPDDWAWVYAVNVMGVVHGVSSFLPLMRRGATIANTASVAGLVGAAGSSIYSSSKAAVIVLSQSLRSELAPVGIDVSVLLPYGVRSRIRDAQRNRTPKWGPRAAEPLGTAPTTGGTDPVDAGRAAFRGIDQRSAFVFPDRVPQVHQLEWITQLLAATPVAAD